MSKGENAVITIKKNEHIEQALRRLKRKLSGNFSKKEKSRISDQYKGKRIEFFR